MCSLYHKRYQEGEIRELITLTMLKYFQDGTVLFSSDRSHDDGTYGTWAVCHEKYQIGPFKGAQACLGMVSKHSGFGGFIFSGSGTS